MKKYFYSIIVRIVVWASPLVVFAQPAAGQSGDIRSFIGIIISSILNPALWLLLALGLVLFLWGVVKYIQSGENSDQRAESVKFMTWGVVALFVMVSVYGLIKVVQNTFRLSSATQTGVPQLYPPGSPGPGQQILDSIQ